MLKKLGFFLLGTVALCNAPSYAATTHALSPGITLEYEFLPNQPQTFVNYMFWEIVASCKITTDGPGSELEALALAKKGKVNNTILLVGESMRLTVHSGDVLKLSADSGAKVQITNYGQHPVKAICST